MDPHTLHAYNYHAPIFCARYRRAHPLEVYRLIQTYFSLQQPTADIGCGSGRDVAWLNRHGYPAIGYDAAPAMLKEASRVYPDVDFCEAALPELASIADDTFANVLCCAVLMHLPMADIPHALHNLARILKHGGRLLFSYRANQQETEREADGRLFTALDAAALQQLLEEAGLHLLQLARQPDATRPGIYWLTLVGEKPAGS
jgi:SAM-dependent methyltransferase